jgi:hypothetical protein
VELRPPFFEPGRWVAPLNYATGVREHWIVPDRVEIHDVTLRDGEQTARIVFTPDEKQHALVLKNGLPLQLFEDIVRAVLQTPRTSA